MSDSRITASEPASRVDTDQPADTAAITGRIDGNRADGPLILVIDNYDSFVYNLVQYVGEFAGTVVVRRNDAVDRAAVRALAPDGIVLSPGPGTPESAGVSMDVADLARPVFGVCLGHQALCAARGSPVNHAPRVVHGKASKITHDGEGLFAGLDAELSVGRYHSLCVDRDDLPAALVETAHTTDDREIVMGVRHRDRPQFGVQFHPESILTDAGKAMVANFVDICEAHDD